MQQVGMGFSAQGSYFQWLILNHLKMLCSKWPVWSQLKAITGSAVAGGSTMRTRVLVNLLY